jgi:uncharacterized OB-fold protein
MEQNATAVAEPTHRLRFQRCSWCRSVQPHPSLLCRVCRSESLRWEDSAGFGLVVTSPPSTARTPEVPPRPSRVQLDEGPLVVGWIRGGPDSQLWQGARVRFSTADPSGRPVFELA